MINYIYKLEEMLEDMNQSINNLNEVIIKQIELNDIIKESSKKEDFEDFLKSSEESIERMSDQIKELNNRRTLLSQIITEVKDNTVDKDTLGKLMNLLGLLVDDEDNEDE